MSRVGSKNRPLACTTISFNQNPQYNADTGKFISPLPTIVATNAEVIDTEDGELSKVGTQRIRVQAQLDAGLITMEELIQGGALNRKLWDNEALLEQEVGE